MKTATVYTYCIDYGGFFVSRRTTQKGYIEILVADVHIQYIYI